MKVNSSPDEILMSFLSQHLSRRSKGAEALSSLITSATKKLLDEIPPLTASKMAEVARIERLPRGLFKAQLPLKIEGGNSVHRSVDREAEAGVLASVTRTIDVALEGGGWSSDDDNVISF
jgi:hypothetical protein